MSKERGAAWRAAIEAGTADGPVGDTGIPPGTTHITATDADGNIVLWTHSIGSIAGPGWSTPGLGFLYSNFLGFFNPLPGPAALAGAGQAHGGRRVDAGLQGRSPGPGARLAWRQPDRLGGLPGDRERRGSRHDDARGGVGAALSQRGTGKLFVEPPCPEEVSATLTAQGTRWSERPTWPACRRCVSIRRPAELSAGADPRAEGGVASWPGGLCA